MLSKSEIKNLEKKFGFIPHKKLGQNFLIDANIKNKLLDFANVKKSDVVLEIGSGLGQLTFDLSKMAKKVIAVEFDRKLFSVFSEFTKDFANIVPVHDDFLKFNLGEFVPKGRKVKVISNLPYYISARVLLKLCAHNEYIDSALLTLQKEVAGRLTALPRTKEYGSLTLFAEFHSEIKKLFDVKKNSFYPVPRVDSTVVFMRIRTKPPVKTGSRKVLFELIRAGFSTRRKTLLNALSAQNYNGLSKKRLREIFKAAGIDSNARAETLSLGDFARISNTAGR
ncbi:MAG: 16S rRNA (adenine(1518)-N(6)/adenine(1519)-N(6))-dimethyltransferase RsmA [Candidatus Omnitrophota bacterium]|nr:16S rRNA (adenine(1518)-N(6)/adenine(1519)-N(6))-dimethyltransferase RsmA [Candidatus Omnitrophota bacterium]